MSQSSLGMALVGLAEAQPQSGYALRNVFENSPLGVFSSSPGSIYPALAKLTTAGFLDRRPQAGGEKPLYHVTDSGRQALHRWLRSAITVEEIAKDVDVVLLRFAFLQNAPKASWTLQFLLSFIDAVRDHLNRLEEFLQSDAGRVLSMHGRLAMQNGIRGYETHLAWAMDAMKEFQS